MIVDHIIHIGMSIPAFVVTSDPYPAITGYYTLVDTLTQGEGVLEPRVDTML